MTTKLSTRFTLSETLSEFGILAPVAVLTSVLYFQAATPHWHSTCIPESVILSYVNIRSVFFFALCKHMLIVLPK